MRSKKYSRKEQYDNMQVAIGKRLMTLRIESGYPNRQDFTALHDLPPALYEQVENGKANLT
jgi:hypothetical protein